jgi:hypothetical protein
VRRALNQKRSASGLLLVSENLASRSPDLRVEIFESANQALDDESIQNRGVLMELG